MTLITAMLIMIYKRENELGYDMAKFCFCTEMNDWVTALFFLRRQGSYQYNFIVFNIVVKRGKRHFIPLAHRVKMG